MKAVILAAGTGSRLGTRTANRPKCLVQLAGLPLLDWQLRALRVAGVDDISIVTGAHADQLAPYDLTKFHNPHFASTNMVASLMCARELFDGSDDVLIVYGDIVYEPRVVEAALRATHPLNVVVDRQWRQLWQLRMEDPLADAETLRILDGRLTELGRKPTTYDDIEAQYIGMILVRRNFAVEFVRTHDGLDPEGPYEGRDRANMFMTTLLQHFIDNGTPVGAATTDGGWVEVDTNDDLDAYEALIASDSFRSYLDLGALS